MEMQHRSRLLEALSIARATASQLGAYQYADLIIESMYSLNFGNEMADEVYDAFRMVARQLQNQFNPQLEEHQDIIKYLELQILRFANQDEPMHWR